MGLFLADPAPKGGPEPSASTITLRSLSPRYFTDEHEFGALAGRRGGVGGGGQAGVRREPSHLIHPDYPDAGQKQPRKTEPTGKPTLTGPKSRFEKADTCM